METTTAPANKTMSPTLIGVLLSLMLIIFSQVTILLDKMQDRVLGWIPMGICIIVVIWSCINFSKQNNYNVTFGNVFVHGFKIAATITALMALYTILLFLVIKPGLQDVMMEKAREGMEKKGTDEAQIEQGLAMAKRMFVPFAVIGVILLYGIGGAVISLIGAAVAKKNPNPNPF